MVLGIITGLIAALFQSGSYVFSRQFLAKHHSSWQLIVYSQLAMGILGGITMIFMPMGNLFQDPVRFLLTLFFWIAAMVTGQYAFFRSLKEIEASRLASLLGLKILILAAISLIFLKGRISGMQTLAIFVSAAAAMAMNWSGGGKLSLKGCIWLFVTLVFYSLADLAETRMVWMVQSGSMIRDGVIIGGVSYFALGVCTLPALCRCPRNWRLLCSAVPFGVAWYYAMTALYMCFGLLGTVFGNVVQSSRGLFSVLIGLVLAEMGATSIESKISKAAWVRRGIAALLMMLAIFLYSYGSK
ncbi:MAG: EamA family transporter [Lentisphaeria bacterium]|nr:EamA family transporter [Lentisphaeria bacterium]